jgi:hypothetical protein
MKFSLPSIPAWAIALLVALAGAASLGAEIVLPGQGRGARLEDVTGFYAGAGFGAALLVLGGAWIVRLLRDRPNVGA